MMDNPGKGVIVPVSDQMRVRVYIKGLYVDPNGPPTPTAFVYIEYLGVDNEWRGNGSMPAAMMDPNAVETLGLALIRSTKLQNLL
jgi:hypothetical protein